MRGIKIGSEDEMQANLFVWIRAMMSQYSDLESVYALPLGGKRPMLTAVRMKATGAPKGVPDLHCPLARHGFHGLWIELKLPKKKPSPEQAEWIERLTNAGHKVVVHFSWTDAANEIGEYLGLPLKTRF